MTATPPAPLLAADTAADDPLQWLEAIDDSAALDWVRAHNAATCAQLEASPAYRPIHDRLLAILDSEARIPYVTKLGAHYYNFWRDARQLRGVWRRTTYASYTRAEPDWETVLDLDALAAVEGENWVWNGVVCREPDADRCLLQLSRGGGDAVVIREFDLVDKRFVADGFQVPEAKTEISWIDRDHVYVATDFGPGSLTDSGYPRTVREWRRGTPLAEAVEVFAGARDDVAASAVSIVTAGHRYRMIRRVITFYSGEHWLKVDSRFQLLPVPDDAQVGFWRDQMTVELRSDWTVGGVVHPAGALLAIGVAEFLAGQRRFAQLYRPGPRSALSGVAGLRHALIINELHEVRSRLHALKPGRDGWTRTAIEAPAFGALGVSEVDDHDSDDYWLTVTDFLTPTTLFRATLDGAAPERLKALPAFFATDGLEIVQHHASSKDGTQVPYFQVSRRGLPLDGRNPTLLYGYGGFEVSMLPSYSAGVGAAWLERGGTYVLANIRGGGEFGPAWHQAALKEHRQRAYDDFIAIAEDLIRRGVTAPPHLGIQGGSNGGLLMGVMLTQRPELFGAVVCQVPLLDMRRYHQLLAGASWIGEYGNPDLPEEWAWIARYSPYQKVAAGSRYPRVLFTTSTRDDRVHPGHARKMAARMAGQGHDVLYYENLEGGHGGAANNPQLARMGALAYAFLWLQLSRPDADPES
jgi:prolyl oligopeptidase